MKLLSPFYNLLSIFAILIFIPSLFFGKQMFDVHFHDTYYALPIGQFLKMNSFIMLALWMVYKLAENVLFSEKLMRIHVISSTLTVVVMSTAVYWASFTIWTEGAHYYPTTSPDVTKMFYANMAILITLYAFAIAQALLLFNIVYGLIKKDR